MGWVNQPVMGRAVAKGGAAPSPLVLSCALALLVLGGVWGCDSPQRSVSSPGPNPAPAGPVPEWARGAVFYQVFPERFRNGDPSNNPTRDSLERPQRVPESWRVSSWGGDWYARDGWEREIGEDFYRSGLYDRRYGGDLQGIIEQLPYLERLGVDAIYLNPIFYARSLHKYDATCWRHIDPYFGPDPKGDIAKIQAESSDPDSWAWTEADLLFLRLLREAHDVDLRVVVDGVFNHTGRDFFAFRDLVERQQESPYRDWYEVSAFDDPATAESEFRYRGWNGHQSLPELADSPDGSDLAEGPRQYVYDVTRRWMDPNGDGDPADGVDGWRLDVATDVPTGFWREWNKLVRSINPRALTVAEVWDDAAAYVEDAGFGSVMNYHGFAMPVKGLLIDGALSPSVAADMLAERWAAFSAERRFGLWNLIDSHDTERLASMIVNASDGAYDRPERFDYDFGDRSSPRVWDRYDVRRPNAAERRIQRMVVLMQVTFPGSPLFYYGDEAGMWGADDPDDRMPMVWGDLVYDDQAADPLGRSRRADPVGVDDELWQFYQSACWLRRQVGELREGEFEVVLADDERGLFGFKRSGDNREAVVLFNRSESTHEIELKYPGRDNLREAFTASGESGEVWARYEDETLKVRLPGLDAVVVLSHSGE